MTYMGVPYYPRWLDNLADDVTLEGAAMSGTAQGAEAVHAIVVAARTLHEEQIFSFAGDYDDNAYIEEYSCKILGAPPALSSRFTATTTGRPRASQCSTGHATRCCSSPARCTRSSPTRPLQSTSSPPSPEADLFTTADARPLHGAAVEPV